MRMVASSFSGVLSRVEMRSRDCSSSISSICVRLSEKNAISAPELKAESMSPIRATKKATIFPGVRRVVSSAVKSVSRGMQDNGSGSNSQSVRLHNRTWKGDDGLAQVAADAR